MKLIEQLLTRNPTARPASAAHVAEALLLWCAGHNLPALLTRCRQRATAEPTLEQTAAVRLHTSQTPPARPPRRAWLAFAWLAPLAACAGVVILLETQKGQLIIESDVAGVKVNVLQDGKVYQQLQVQTGAQSTRLFADKYAIEIDGASDGLTVDQSSVEIRRGATVVARVKQAAKADRVELDLSATKEGIEPLYAGQTLSQWLEVLERDLDIKTRLDTLSAIERLASTADTQTRERINRALLDTIATVAQQMQWTRDGHQLVPADDQGLTMLLKSLMSINHHEPAFKLLQEGCLLHEGRVNLSTIAILANLWPFDLHRSAGDWLLSDGRFQSLGAPEAWAGLAFLQNLLRYRDADYFKKLPEAILQQPQLGLPALLLLKPRLSNEEQITFFARPETIQLEETIARNAREAFLSDESSPQIVAMSAHWLARTTSNVDEHRAELIEKIRSRMKQLASDDDRLLAVAPEVVASVPAKSMPKVSTSGGRRSVDENIQGPIQAFPLNTIGLSNSQRMTFVGSYSRSELVSILALGVRLHAVRELDDSLTQMAERVFANALPAVVASHQSGVTSVPGFSWPFDDDQVKRLPAPLNTVPPAAWRAAKLAATIKELAREPLFNTQLYQLILGDTAQGIIVDRDKNGDGQIADAEASDYFLWGVDLDKDGLISKDELIEHLLAGPKSAYIQRRFGDLAVSRNNPLTAQRAAPAISQSQFEEIDANNDNQLTQDELITYGMSHPQPATPQVAPPQAGTVNGASQDDARRAWAVRQISRYDKNAEGQLSADEWGMMIIKPKEGTDANDDGIITLEELAASTKFRVNMRDSSE